MGSEMCIRDRSKTGIGVVAYAITKASTGVINSRIIYSKSSLMPKNLREKAKLEDALTIARAELIAMVCCVTMMDYLREAYNPHLSCDKVVIFTDSLLNLQRIQRGKGKCKPFEERRVCKVLDGKGQAEVRFCPGVENPSDLPSRGCNLSELQDHMQFWKEGRHLRLANRAATPEARHRHLLRIHELTMQQHRDILDKITARRE